MTCQAMTPGRTTRGGTACLGCGAEARKPVPQAGGFTLVECLVAAVLLTVAALSVSSALIAGGQASRQAVTSQRAAELINEMHERISSLPYHDPQGGGDTAGPESGETTAMLFDNMDDFHGYVESPGQIKDAAGVLFPAEYQRFTRSVTAAYENRTISGLGGTVDGLNVTVTVTDPSGGSTSVSQFHPRLTSRGG